MLNENTFRFLLSQFHPVSSLRRCIGCHFIARTEDYGCNKTQQCITSVFSNTELATGLPSISNRLLTNFRREKIRTPSSSQWIKWKSGILRCLWIQSPWHSTYNWSIVLQFSKLGFIVTVLPMSSFPYIFMMPVVYRAVILQIHTWVVSDNTTGYDVASADPLL